MPCSSKRKRKLKQLKTGPVFEDMKLAIDYAEEYPDEFSLWLYRTPGKGLGERFHLCIDDGLPVGKLFSQDSELLKAIGGRAGMQMLLIQKRLMTIPTICWLNICDEPLKNVLDELGLDIENWRDNAKEKIK